jgi:predicted Zn-dependent peptidase
LRIVTEEERSVRSAAFRIWVNVGSRDRSLSTAGASHFLEHLSFKGTKLRTSLDISSAIEAVGGETNAFSSKEYTCFYARVIYKYLPLAVDVISDLIHDLFLEKYYGDTPLGRPILGTVESIKSMHRNTVFNYYKNRYQPNDLVVAVAGNIKHKNVVHMVEDALGRDGFLDQPKRDYRLRTSGKIKVPGRGKVTLLDRKTEQAHIIYGVPSVARDDKRRFALSILASALGGGMSSRLFQEIRERRGLAYSTYAYNQQFAGSGVLSFYVGCKPEKAEEAVKIIQSILHDVANNGLTDEEIARAKGAVSGALVLSQEDTGSRMTRIGKSELVYGQLLSFDEILREISDVTQEQIKEIARQILPESPTLAVVGPFRSTSKFERLIK